MCTKCRDWNTASLAQEALSDRTLTSKVCPICDETFQITVEDVEHIDAADWAAARASYRSENGLPPE